MINNQKILYKFIQINNNVKCDTMSYQYILSENFIREFKNKINYNEIIIKKLSENLIRVHELKNKINCDNILIMRKIL